MNIQQIIYVIEINKCNSFSVAANSLFISQPRLSQAVRELEKELGFDIFERNRKGIIGPTLKGYEFISKAKKVLRDFNSLSNFIETSEKTFRLTTTLIPQAQNAFTELVKKFGNLSSSNFEMFFCGCFESADKVINNGYDMGVVTIIDDQFKEWLQYFESNGLIYRELKACPFHITVSRTSDLAEKNTIRTSDLANLVYVTEKCSKMNNLTLEVYSIFDSLFSTSKVTVSNTDIMYTLVSENNAFTLDTLALDQTTLDRYNLVSIPFDNKLFAHNGYIYRKDTPLTGISLEYINILTSLL